MTYKEILKNVDEYYAKGYHPKFIRKDDAIKQVKYYINHIPNHREKIKDREIIIKNFFDKSNSSFNWKFRGLSSIYTKIHIFTYKNYSYSMLKTMKEFLNFQRDVKIKKISIGENKEWESEDVQLLEGKLGAVEYIFSIREQRKQIIQITVIALIIGIISIFVGDVLSHLVFNVKK